MTSRFEATLNAAGTQYELTWRSDHEFWAQPYRIQLVWMNPTPGGHFPVAFDYEPAPRRSPMPLTVGDGAAGGDAADRQRTGHPTIRIVAGPGVKVIRDTPDPEETAAEQARRTRPAARRWGSLEPFPPPPSETLCVRVTRVQSEDQVPPVGVNLAAIGVSGQYRTAPYGYSLPSDTLAWPGEVAEPGLPAVEPNLAIEVYPQSNGVIFYNAWQDTAVMVAVPVDSTQPIRVARQMQWTQRFAYQLDYASWTAGAPRLAIMCTPGVEVIIVDNRDPVRILSEPPTPDDHGFTVAVYETDFASVPSQGEPLTLSGRPRDHLHELRGVDPQEMIDMVHLIFSLTPFVGDVVDLGDFIHGCFYGRDLAGRPLSSLELCFLAVCVILPFV